MNDQPAKGGHSKAEADSEADHKPMHLGIFFAEHWIGISVSAVVLVLLSPLLTFPGGNPKQLWWVCGGVCLLLNTVICWGFYQYINRSSPAAPGSTTQPSTRTAAAAVAADPDVRLPGWSLHFLIRIHHLPSTQRKYIMDIGHVDRERLSLYVSSDDVLTFSFTDAKGEPHPLQIPLGGGGFPLADFAHLCCELGVGGGSTTLRLYANGEEIGSMVLPFKTDLGALDLPGSVIGADLNGANGAAFDLRSLTVYSPTLTKKQLADVDEYVRSQTFQQFIKCDGNSWMRAGDVVTPPPTGNPPVA